MYCLSLFIYCNHTSWILWGDPGKVQMSIKMRRTEHTWQVRAHVKQIYQKERTVNVSWKVQENDQLNTKDKRHGFFSDNRKDFWSKLMKRWGKANIAALMTQIDPTPGTWLIISILKNIFLVCTLGIYKTAASSFLCSQLKYTEEWDFTWKHSLDTRHALNALRMLI